VAATLDTSPGRWLVLGVASRELAVGWNHARSVHRTRVQRDSGEFLIGAPRTAVVLVLPPSVLCAALTVWIPPCAYRGILFK
jgi:hypothetical protein